MKKVVLGGLLLVLGLFMLLGFVVSVTNKGRAVDLADVIMLLLFVVGPICGASALFYSYFGGSKALARAQSRSSLIQREREIFLMAQHKGGRLTISDLIAGTSLDSDTASSMMKEMAVKGYVNMDVTDRGVVVYEFHEIANR